MAKTGKCDMIHDSATPKATADPESDQVKTGRVPLSREPAKTLPMAQCCFLF